MGTVGIECDVDEQRKTLQTIDVYQNVDIWFTWN
jgi:hypothetical protein